MPPSTEPNRAGRRPLTMTEALTQPTARVDLRRLPRLVAQAVTLVWQAAPARLIGTTVLQFVAGGATAAQLLVVKQLLDGLLADGGPAVSGFIPNLALFAGLLTVAGAAGLASAELQRVLSQKVEEHAARQVIDVATRVELLAYDRPAFYDALQRARVNAGTRPLQMTNGLMGLLNAGVTSVAVAGTVLWLEPTLLVLIAFGFVPTWWVNRVGARALHRHAQSHTPGDRRRGYLYDVLTRKSEAHEIRAFDSARFLRNEHDRLYDAKLADLQRVSRRRFKLGLLGVISSTLVTAGTLGLLLVFVATGRMDLATAGTAVGAVMILAGRLRGLVTSSSSLYEGSLFLEDFTTFIAEYGVPADSSGPSEVRESGCMPTPREGFETIELDAVSFTYPSRDEPSLRDITTTLHLGEVVALVGENGSGKTTLAKILAGLYEPTAGALQWDGINVAESGLEAVRDQTTVIFQDYARYFLTAHDNIAIGRPSRADDHAKAASAARDAGAEAFLSELPEGFASLLGPAFVGGNDLSGGQWQRVALARAYFRDAPLLILDEPTASLDPRAEYEIFATLRRLAAGRTVVLISHRFSSARAADRILVLDQGRLIEQGPHEALVAEGGLYAELFSLQASHYTVPAG